MTRREAAVISAYTGILLGNFSDMHAYVEKILGGPVWTHQLGDPKVFDLIKERSRLDFLAIMEQVSARQEFEL